MASVDEVIEFVRKYWGRAPLGADDDLFGPLDGDDAFELLDDYSKTFHVDISGYLWYFHHGEEGANLGGLFIKPPYRRVRHIPVTPQMLANFASSGRWEVDYPPHVLPKHRYDIYLTWWLFPIVFVLLLLFGFFSRRLGL